MLVLLAMLLLGMGVPDAYAVEEPASRWIVVYKNAAFKAQAVQRRAGKTRHSYKIIPGYAADLSATEIEQLRNDPNVASVEPDAIRHTLKTTSSNIYITDGHYSTAQASGPVVPYGIDLVHARDVWPYTKGAGVRVADIDTGIDLQHPDMPSIVASRTFTNMPVQDSVGHGTHTAGTIAAPGNGTGVAGVAPQASLLVAQVFDNAGNAHDSDIIAGIDWAVQNGAKVINMSLGGSTFDQALSNACQNAVNAGAVVVAAAGNDGTSAPSYPADYPSVLAVAAVDQSMQKASFSSFGPSVDLSAPGVGVLSTAPVGTGWLTSANWSATEHQTSSMEGSANGTVTGSAVYCGLGNPADFPAGVGGQIAHIRRGTLLFQDKVNNAVAAGAAGVIISNNTLDAVNGQLGGNAPVVVVVVSQANGDELQANDGVIATITNQKPADYISSDGTSMSSPHVSGVAALLIAARHGQITPAEVTSAMETTARDLGAAGRDDLYGYGLVDALAALGRVIPVLQSLSASPAQVGAGDPVTVTAQLSTSTGLASLTANGVALSASGGVWTGSVPADSAPGLHTIDVAVTDDWGNIHHDTSLTYTTATSAPPDISISAPSVSATTTGPVSYTVTYTNAATVTLAAGNVTLNKTGTANGTVGVSGSGSTARTVTISGITGNGTIGISIGAGTASNASGSAPAVGPSATFAVTSTVPGIAIGAPSVSSTTAGPVSYTVAYSNATDVTLAAGNITLNTTGTATGAVAVSGSGNATRTVTISNISGAGTLGISIGAGTASNPAGSALAVGPSATFSVANTLPGIAIGAPSVGSTTAGPVSYTVTYSNATAVTLAAGDITLNKTGTAVGAVSVSGSGSTTRAVIISSIIGDGTIGISIAAGTASNAAGSALAAGPGTPFAVGSETPVVTFTFPAAAVTRNCPNLDIAGTASGSLGIASVAWALNGQPGGACLGTVSWSAAGITLAPGANTLTVTATDTLGNTGGATLTVTHTDAKPGSAWQGTAMVSLPIIPDSADPRPAVGFTSTGWYLYDTSASSYVAYPDQRTWFTPLDATPGRGFWAFFSAGGGNTPCGTIPPQNQAKTIHLHEGWNIIGQPFVNSVAWDSQAITVIRTPGSAPAPLADCADAVANYAWGWDAVNGSYYLVMDAAFASGAVGELSPWQAYWIVAFQDCDLILPPP